MKKIHKIRLVVYIYLIDFKCWQEWTDFVVTKFESIFRP